MLTVESSSINIALCNVAETRCNCVQKQSVIRRIPEISSLNIYCNVKLNRTQQEKLSVIVLTTEEAGQQADDYSVSGNCNDS